MVLCCLARIHQQHTRSQTKSGTLQQTKSKKSEANRPFPLPNMKCCLFRVGAGHSGRDGWGWGGVNSYYTMNWCTNGGSLWVIAGIAEGDTGGVKDLLWRLGVNHLSGTRQFYSCTCRTPIPLGGGVLKHTHTKLNLHVSYNAKLKTHPFCRTTSRPFCLHLLLVYPRAYSHTFTHVCLLGFSTTG